MRKKNRESRRTKGTGAGDGVLTGKKGGQKAKSGGLINGTSGKETKKGRSGSALATNEEMGATIT